MAARILPVSDLHFEFHKDDGGAFTDELGLQGENCDVLVVAGDLTVAPRMRAALELLCAKFKKVVYVTGNHEYYAHSSFGSVVAKRRAAVAELPNLAVLDRGQIIINGQRFLGVPMWFPRPPGGVATWGMNDFQVIDDFENWVYVENKRAVEWLWRAVKRDDVVITHHLPSYKSVHPKYKNSPLNAFFVCDVERLILEKKPRLWIHGHTHESCDYFIGETRVVCNPFGYARIEENQSFDFGKIIEVG